MIATLLLAAGASRRMGGRDKLLEDIDGEPILARQTQRALSVGPTYVTLPSKDHPRAQVVPLAAQIIAVTGEMSDSLRAGITALPASIRGVIVLPADMPDITEQDLRQIRDTAETTDAPIVRATTGDGHVGHPIYFSARLFDEFKSLTGDRGAFSLTQAHKDQTVFVTLEGDRARLDLDTPQDWAAFRTR